VGKTKAMRRKASPVEILIDQKEMENVEYFNHLGSIIKNYARCTCKIKCRSVMAKPAFRNKKTLFTRKLDLNLKKNLFSATFGEQHCVVLKI
jgi:hypothetical protein